jgi:membrane-bound serine protease (ClpP class)
VVDRSIIATTTAVFSVIAAAITLMVLRDRRQPAHTGAEGIIGERGVAISPIHRDGKVHVHGEIWNARSVTPIQTGRTVQVIRIEGLTLTVEPSQER